MDMFEGRRIDIGYLQEVRYRGHETRVYGGEEKYKFGGVDQRRAEME